MSASGPLELLARPDGERTALCAPSVGWFTAALPAGRVLVAGETAGCLITLGLARTLIVPRGVAGRIVNAAPERVHEPVGYGSTLYELAPLSESPASTQPPAEMPAASASELVFRSPSAGRFWLRSAPKDPPYVQAGAEIAEGQALGLIEVMKTFTRLTYKPEGGLPPRARVLRVLVADGADVREGEALIEIESL